MCLDVCNNSGIIGMGTRAGHCFGPAAETFNIFISFFLCLYSFRRVKIPAEK